MTQFIYINDITINSYLEITTNNKKQMTKHEYYNFLND